MKTVNFSYKKEARQNPFIGIMSFQHFRNDALYSDLVVKPENNMTETEHVECYPVPDYVKEDGRSEGYYPDCSVVYIRILWKEFEPEEGKFNYAFIEDILQKARDNDQTVMFRLMQHSTRETDDVPDWVKLKVECPARPLGERVKTSPKDPLFLELFGRAIKAFANRFDSDPTLAFMDISLPGAWGEGSSCKLFSEADLKKLCAVYTDNFKNTLLIGQVSEPWLVNYMNEENNVGWRADCIGGPWQMTKFVPTQETQMSEIWKKGHVSFESYWWLGEWQRKEWDLDQIIELTLKWHMSTFNAKSLPIPFEWQKKIDEWNSKMGYHFVIDEVSFPESVSDKLNTKLKIDNVGVAPIYNKLPLYLKLKAPENEYILETDVDICRWIEGKYTEDIEVALPADIKSGEYSLQIGIGGGDSPAVLFASDAALDGDCSVIGKIEIK